MSRSLPYRVCVILSVLLAFISSGIMPASAQIEDETQDAVQAGLAAAGERTQEKLARREEAAKEPSPGSDEEVAVEEAAEATLEVRPEIVDKAMASYRFSLKQIVKKAEKNMARVQKEIARHKKDEEADEESAEGSGEASAAKVSKEAARKPVAKKAATRKKKITRKGVVRARPRPVMTKPPRKKCEVEAKRRMIHPVYMPRPARRPRPTPCPQPCRPAPRKPTTTPCKPCKPSSGEAFLKQQEAEEAAIRGDMQRFAAKHASRVPREMATDETFIACQETQEAAIRRDMDRFHGKQGTRGTGGSRLTGEEMVVAWDRYDVIEPGEKEEVCAYLAGEGASK